MRLFAALMATKNQPRFLYRGKNRLVKKVKLPALQELYVDYGIQEKNMLILRHPYLTVEQSKGHMSEAKESHVMSKRANLFRNEKFAKKFTWAEQLSHLRVRDAWD